MIANCPDDPQWAGTVPRMARPNELPGPAACQGPASPPGPAACPGPASPPGPTACPGPTVEPIFVRLAHPGDAEAIRTIYNVEVTGSTSTLDMVERTPTDQERWMTEHQGAYPAVVAEIETVVAGFGSLTRYRDRPGYSATVEDSVYVDARFRGRGVGRVLLSELVRLADDHGFHSVLARIGGGGEPSIRLHAACGFSVVGVEKEVGRKHGHWIDVTVMQRMV